jgi:hypothetical protein
MGNLIKIDGQTAMKQGREEKKKACFSMEGERDPDESQTGTYLKKHQEKVYNPQNFNQRP